MKCKLDCFLKLNSDLAIKETDQKKIRTLFEKTFETTFRDEILTLYDYSLKIQEEIEICKNEFYEKLYELDFPKEIKDLVNAKHTKLESLKDRIIDKIGEQERYKVLNFKSELTGYTLYQLLFVSLDQFQASLERNHVSHIIIDNHVSTDNLNSSIGELFDTVQEIRNYLNDHNINKELVSMFLYPSQRMILIEEEERFRIKDLIYFKKFVGVFNGLIKEKRENITDKDVVHTLFYLNFNTSKFYDFAVKYIHKEMMDATSQTEKYNVLQKYLVETKCGQVCTQVFQSDRESIKVLLYDFCKAENKYFEAVENLENELQNKPLDDSYEYDSDIPEKAKLWMNLPVDSLSHLVKSMKNIGLIENESLTDTYKIVSKFVRTVKKPNVSHKSLFNKSYELSDKSRNELIAYMELLLKDLRNHK